MLRPFNAGAPLHHEASLRNVRTMMRQFGRRDLDHSCGRLRSVKVPGVLANGRCEPLRKLFVSTKRTC